MAKANVANTLVVPTETTVFPYYDDFNEDKNFHRILFRPGYAVQARELTQLQTILQNQIERFGRHIFENGSMVIGGELFYSPEPYDTINLSPTFANTNIDVTQFDKKLIVSTDAANTIQFRVLNVEQRTDSQPPILHGKYISGDYFSNNQTFIIKGEATKANTAESNVNSTSAFVGIRDSIFFYNGYFIKVPYQTTIVGKHTTVANARIGLELSDSIVTEQSDTSLLDPAQESFNYQAPGAARYKADLVLSTRSLDSEDDSKFIELGRVEGLSLRNVVKYPIYSEIEEVLARRTYDESGNYTVKPFNLVMSEDRFDAVNNVAAVLSPGKGYVYGYEIETYGPTSVSIKKGRTLKSVDAWDLNMNYGNYVIVDGLKGVFDTSVADVFDIHCVSTADVNYDTSETYNRSKIGYGRIKDLEFFSGDVDVDARKYEFYILDTNFINISSDVAATLGTSNVILSSNNLLTRISGAYDGALLRITSGPGAGYSYNIESYNATTNTFTLTTNFFETPTSDSKAAIEFNFGSADSFVKKYPYTSGATSNASANITTLNKSGSISTGSAFIGEASLSTLLFDLPDTYIAYGANGITNAVYSYRRKYTTTFTAGVSTAIQVDNNENFLGATSSSNISSTIMNNFLVVCTDKGVSARANGDIIKPTVTVSGSPEQAVFETGNTDVNDTFSATIFAKVEFDPGVVPKQKTLHLMKNDVVSSNTPVQLYSPTTGSTANVYLTDGQVIISNPSRETGVRESLYISDVTAVRIYDMGGQDVDGLEVPPAGTSITAYTDVTDRFELDSGQKDNFYDHASIRLRPNYASCRGPLIVCCRYYEHSAISSGGGGYFSVDSYPNLATSIYENGKYLGDGYSIIPQYVKTDGTVVELRDCIDFRPVRENGTNTSPNFTLQGVKIPLPTTDFELDYEYYLGRKDLIVLDRGGKFLVIEGIPNKYPQEPTAPATAMVLYSLSIPPYTEYPSNVSVKYVDNKRYTMRDIGKIEKRVENLEYYVSLNTLEKNALDITIPDVDGLDRTKYGIFVDSFTSHVLGNPSLTDYSCAMNFQEGWLQNQTETLGVTLKANSDAPGWTGCTITANKILLNYDETSFLTQNSASKFAPLAEFLYASFQGNIIMSPESDIWHSTTQAPDIIITDEGLGKLTFDKIYQSIVDSQSR
jgi:hypothetical protein